MGRFLDEAAKTLATSVSRRKAFLIIGGTLFAALVPKVALAACGSCVAGGGNCTSDGQCCSGTCKSSTGKCDPSAGGACCSGADCSSGKVCCAGTCQNSCSNCGAGFCKCTTTGLCVSSAGANGENCRAGFSGC
jgi:hypothetical protein